MRCRFTKHPSISLFPNTPTEDRNEYVEIGIMRVVLPVIENDGPVRNKTKCMGARGGPNRVGVGRGLRKIFLKGVPNFGNLKGEVKHESGFSIKIIIRKPSSIYIPESCRMRDRQ